VVLPWINRPITPIVTTPARKVFIVLYLPDRKDFICPREFLFPEAMYEIKPLNDANINF